MPVPADNSEASNDASVFQAFLNNLSEDEGGDSEDQDLDEEGDLGEEMVHTSSLVRRHIG